MNARDIKYSRVLATFDPITLSIGADIKFNIKKKWRVKRKSTMLSRGSSSILRSRG